MTRYVVIFTDKSDPALKSVRTEHSEDHFAYLAAHADEIVIAGGLRETPDGWPMGGLWVVMAESEERVRHLAEDDPYFKLGLRQGYVVRVWGKAPNYGVVRL
jgi:hypothetical protein